jgi:hypothetical protein
VVDVDVNNMNRATVTPQPNEYMWVLHVFRECCRCKSWGKLAMFRPLSEHGCGSPISVANHLAYLLYPVVN